MQAMGPCSFDDQSRIYRSAIITVGIENLLLPWYFSDRLPIALASGIPVVYQRSIGFDDIFPPQMAGSWFSDERRMFALVDKLLDGDTSFLKTVSRRGYDFFRESLSRLTVARFVVENTMDCRAIYGADSSVAWQRMPPLLESS
ncbi:glycosyltransferase family 1 protein [bacterium]|nr:glycosyltransferase family 1 protein [bacterium]